MKVKKISIQHLQIPLRIRFAQANNQTNYSDTVLVRIETNSGVTGLGESCPRTYVTGENVESVTSDLQSIESALIDQAFDSIATIADYVCLQLPSQIGLAAICGLELALLDAYSKELGLPLVDLLGGQLAEHYAYTGVLPFGKIERLRPVLNRFHFREVKLKVDRRFEEQAARISALRKIYGSEVRVRVDANGAWDFAAGLEYSYRYAELGVFCIEQPFSAEKHTAMSFLTEECGDWLEIMADESLTDYSSALALVKLGACSRFNIKLSKNGGIFNSLRIYRLAQKNGITCQLGAHFGETSILTAAGLVFASLTGKLAAMEGGFGLHLLEKDITRDSLMIDAQSQIRGAKMQYKLGLGEVVAEQSILVD